MSCGVNIPLSSVVEAIVNDYADVFVGEILKRVSLNTPTINNGTFIDATIRGGLTFDEYRQRCIMFGAAGLYRH